jgi:hypothetical protein
MFWDGGDAVVAVADAVIEGVRVVCNTQFKVGEWGNISDKWQNGLFSYRSHQVSL